jgi:PAS domain S-box-containing protein
VFCQALNILAVIDDLKSILNRVEGRQKKLEELSQYLHELESHLALVFAFSPDLILLSDDAGKILRVNYSVEQILGYKPSEIIGTKVWDYIHPDDVEETLIVREQLKQNTFFTSDGRKTFTNHWRKKNGDYARLVWRFAYYDNNNRWMIKFATDYSYIDAEDPYSAQLIVNCVNNANSGIVITDYTKPDNPIVYANKKFEQMSGFTQEELIGENARIFNQDYRDQEAIHTIREAVAGGVGCEVLIKNNRPNGESWFNHLIIEPVSENGKITHFIGSSRDVSALIAGGCLFWDPTAARGFGRKRYE